MSPNLSEFPILLAADAVSRSIVDDLRPDFSEFGDKAQKPECTSLAWSADGQTLFAGYTDKVVRVWVVTA